MTIEYFENVSRTVIRKTADFSYCSHNDDFLSLGHLKIFRNLRTSQRRYDEISIICTSLKPTTEHQISCHFISFERSVDRQNFVLQVTGVRFL